MGVSDKSTGDTISFSDINDELGNASTATLDMKTAGDSFSGINTDGVYSITEFYGVSDASPAFSSFTAAGNASTTGRIDINWGISGPVNTFSLLRATSVDGSGDLDENITIVSSDNDASHTDTGLSNSGTNAGVYYYQATATNTDPNPNKSTNSSVVSATLLPTVTSPSATANVGIGGRIDLAWTNNGTITQVVVKRADNEAMSTNLSTILTDTSSPFATSFSDTGQSGQKYYRIDITNATGTTNSAVVNATATSAIARTIEQGLRYGADGQTDETILGWATNELIECVEDTNSATEPSFGSSAPGFSLESTINYDLTTTSGGWNNGSVAKLQSDGTTTFDGDARFWRNDTDEKIHQIAANGAISNTISYVPATLTISLVSKTDSSVTVRATGNTQVAKTLRFYRDTTEGTKTDHTKGAVGNTSVTADFTFSSLSPNTQYAFKVRGENAEKNGADSNIINVTTDAAGWTSVPADFDMHIVDALSLAPDSTISPLKTATLTGTGGTTQVTCAQPSGNSELFVALSTSGDPGTGATFNDNNPTISHSSGTLYMRFKLVEPVNSAPFGDPDGEDLTITFNNTGGSATFTDTSLQINAKIVEDR
jgi:hypothetical protein